MFEATPEIDKQVADLYEVAKSLHRGDILAHDMIEAVLKVKPHEGRWDHVVNRVRRRLEKPPRGIATWPVNGVGYKLLTQDEQLKFLPKKRLLKMSRQERRARRSVEALDDKHLSSHQRRLKLAQLDHLKAAGRSVRSRIRAMAALGRKTETHPRPERAAG
jgi:hypothetical protein